MSSQKIEVKAVSAVNVAIFNSVNQVFLTRRSQKVREPGKWCLPGGHLELGEPWEVAACREVLEETGLVVSELTLFGLYSHPDVCLASPVPHPRGEGFLQTHFLCAAFLARHFSGEFVANDEVDRWGWFDVTHLPEPLVRSHPIRVQDASAFKGAVFIR